MAQPSQATKQVDWCLRKAEKEIEECKRLNKRPKHRGLLQVEPNVEEARKHIEKAEHVLHATDYLMKGKFSDVSTGTLFYAMYHCFLAIAAKFGYESGNQTCTISLIEWLKEQGKIDIDSRYIEFFKYEEVDADARVESVIEMREELTYGTDMEANKRTLVQLMEECKALIAQTKAIVAA